MAVSQARKWPPGSLPFFSHRPKANILSKKNAPGRSCAFEQLIIGQLRSAVLRGMKNIYSAPAKLVKNSKMNVYVQVELDGH